MRTQSSIKHESETDKHGLPMSTQRKM